MASSPVDPAAPNRPPGPDPVGIAVVTAWRPRPNVPENRLSRCRRGVHLERAWEPSPGQDRNRQASGPTWPPRDLTDETGLPRGDLASPCMVVHHSADRTRGSATMSTSLDRPLDATAIPDGRTVH